MTSHSSCIREGNAGPVAGLHSPNSKDPAAPVAELHSPDSKRSVAPVAEPVEAPGKPLGNRGMTVLEVLVSVVILAIAFTSFLRFLTMGDRVRNKGLRAERAALIVQSEADRLLAHSGENVEVTDTTFTVTMGGEEYLVVRKPVEDDILEEPDTQDDLCEVEIVVKRASNDSTVLVSRLVQPVAGEALQ